MLADTCSTGLGPLPSQCDLLDISALVPWKKALAFLVCFLCRIHTYGLQIGNHTTNVATEKEVSFDGLGCSRTSTQRTVNGRIETVNNEDSDLRCENHALKRSGSSDAKGMVSCKLPAVHASVLSACYSPCDFRRSNLWHGRLTSLSLAPCQCCAAGHLVSASEAPCMLCSFATIRTCAVLYFKLHEQ